MALTGPLAANGKQALLGMKIWEEETNAKGGLIGRPVKLVYYDDQSNPSTVPGIYTKLLDVDKVDLVLSGYATNMVAPAMPIVMQKKKTFISLFALDVNAAVQIPELLLGAADRTEDQAFVHRRLVPGRDAAESEADDGRADRRGRGVLQERLRRRARERQEFGVKIVYDKSFPPGTTDFSPIVRALQASNADIVMVCSYPLSSVGIALAVNEANYTPKIIGGAMVGLQATVFKNKLGPKLNGIVNYETWVPSEKMMAPAAEFFKKYQDRAQGRRRRSARLLSRRLGLRLHQHARRRHHRRQERRRRQDRRLCPQEGRRSRPSWATGATARAASGPSPA